MNQTGKRFVVAPHYPPFDRRFFESREDFTVIGSGSLGGKAQGLAWIKLVLETEQPARDLPAIEVSIPRLTVVATDCFDRFMEENRLWPLVQSGLPDDRLAHAFQQGSLPPQIVGDLRALIEKVHQPLAIRSSSLLEDAMYRPFAGVYETKMIPNNQVDAETRFRRLTEAIKFVYASTFSANAQSYVRAAGRALHDEKMAVIIQEVVGRRHGDRFYPEVSGVARSYNFYALGHARPEDGVVSLALGLGKTIVDGGTAWSYSPAWPQSNPPYGSAAELLEVTQTEFWAVNMGKPPAYDPIAETEYMLRASLADAETDGTLRLLASTYDADSDRISIGTGASGPRILTFAPLLVLEELPLNALLRRLLGVAEQSLGAKVEIEFALTLRPGETPPTRLGFLQVRPLVVTDEEVEVRPEEMKGEKVLAASESVLGNGVVEGLTDVVYVRPERFDAGRTPRIAAELDEINRGLAARDRGYLLIGFGRWGSSDPWLGIPVQWAQIAAARVIVEASLAAASADPSQGSHFFHNLTSFRVCYFTLRHTDAHPIDWAWLDAQPAETETDLVRHVRLDQPLRVKVDGRSGRGVILRSSRPPAAGGPAAPGRSGVPGAGAGGDVR